MNKSDFEVLLTAQADAIEDWLEYYLPDLSLEEGGSATKAARYSLLSGGKRIRPIMLIQTALLYQVEESVYRPYASALEMIHTYSLIHDDLPAMDDDDLRRGRPSCHRQFDEATAILAGDLLLNTAFEIMLQSLDLSPSTRDRQIQAALTIAKSAGGQGMIAGQCLDLLYMQEEITPSQLIKLQQKKTGELLSAAVSAGAGLGGAEREVLALWRTLGLALGQIFQMTDDMLDITSVEEVLGKSIGKDARDGKSTYVTVFGTETTRTLIRQKTEEVSEIIGKLRREGLDMDFFESLNVYLPGRVK
ncbi:MAG TPA: polyprenyl synthetase family protein [Clostridiaceae bacterium]|nr:polyprenyl synthetase family protein [Clostridiaceae bacterium]